MALFCLLRRFFGFAIRSAPERLSPVSAALHDCSRTRYGLVLPFLRRFFWFVTRSVLERFFPVPASLHDCSRTRRGLVLPFCAGSFGSLRVPLPNGSLPFRRPCMIVQGPDVVLSCLFCAGSFGSLHVPLPNGSLPFRHRGAGCSTCRTRSASGGYRIHCMNVRKRIAVQSAWTRAVGAWICGLSCGTGCRRHNRQHKKSPARQKIALKSLPLQQRGGANRRDAENRMRNG